MKAKKTWWERLSWPQVVALAVIVAGAVAVLVWMPVEKLEAFPWQAVTGLVAVLVGGSASSVLPSLLRAPDASRAERRERPTEPPVGPAAALLLAVAIAIPNQGCGGASAEVRSAYAIEQARCLINERAIIDEPCGELAPDACELRDRDAMAAERARCDAALRAIYPGGE